MDVSFTEIELAPEQSQIADNNSSNEVLHCDLCDVETIHKIAESLLPGLASACVDNTSGGLVWSPGLVAASIKKEMEDQITQRSESYIAESVVLEGDSPPDDPHEIISDLIDDFASSKRNLFSRVSGWLLSDSREDKIDDFVQEMEINGFWPLNRREALATTMLKNIDLKNIYHCNECFKTHEEIATHLPTCKFRPLECQNEGCSAVFSATQITQHDSVCAFKRVPCEQNCGSEIMRHEMDRHCLTVCSMKKVSCPFYAVGCQIKLPICDIRRHLSDDVKSHLVFVLKRVHKAKSAKSVGELADRLIKEFFGELVEIDDVKIFTLKVRELEENFG